MLICVNDDTFIDVDVDKDANINVDFVVGVSILLVPWLHILKHCY